MSNQEALEALFIVLSEKIYAVGPALIRNDTKAAQLVVSYIKTVDELNTDWMKQKAQDRTRLQDETLGTLLRINALKGLSVDTLRKYIAELWSVDAFAEFSFSPKVNYLD